MKRFAKMKKRITAFLTSMLILVAPVSSAIPAEAATTNATAKVHLLTSPYCGDLAVLIECNGKFGMVDAGEDEDYPDGSDPRYPLRGGIVTNGGNDKRNIEYLRSVGVTDKNFEFIIGTHPHSDHIGAADEIINEFKPKRVYLQEYKDSYITSEPNLWDNLYVYDQMVEAAKNVGAELIQNINSSNANFTLGNDMKIEIKNYGDDYKKTPTSDANNFSLGVLVKANGKSAFVSGDINNFEGDETRLIPQLGKVDVLVLGHHGNYGSNSNAFVTGIDPELMLIPGGYWGVNDSALPNDKSILDTIFEMADKGVPTFAADWFAKMFGAVVVNMGSQITTNIPKDYECVAVTHNTSPASFIYYKNGLPTPYNGEFDGYYFDNSAFGVSTTNTGVWKSDSNGWWYQRADGTYPASQWERIDGFWYYFNSKGYMVTGWQSIKGEWYYLYPTKTTAFSGETFPEGAMATEWLKDGDTWYYMGSDGAMKKDWQLIDGKYYYFNNSGAMLTGKQYINGHYFYLYEEAGTSRDGQHVYRGEMATKWILDGEDFLYADSNGYLLTGWHQLDGDWYYFDSEGVMAIGWRYLSDEISNDAWYYFNTEAIGSANRGKMETGWHYLNSSTGNGYYYFREVREAPWGKGSMVTGPKWLGDYFINADGLRLTNQWVDNNKYYVNASGTKVTNAWQGDYYLQADGTKAVSKWIGESYVGANGKKVTNAWQDGYYLNANGIKAKSTWVDNDNYYVDANGEKLTGWQTIDSNKYYLGTDGMKSTGVRSVDSVEYVFGTSGSLVGKFGDVNNDGIIDIKDATYIQMIVCQLVTGDDVSSALGDVNNDGVIGVNDATVIQKYLCQMITSFS